MKTNHTPGPWQIDNSHNAGNPATLGQMNIKDGNGNLISRCDVGMFWSSNGTANARLIAAAPDLLSALQSIVARVDSPGEPLSA